jgi:hypothetical protein
MIALFCLFLAPFASPFKSKSRLEAENAALRHQLIILRRKVRGRVRLTNSDRLFFIQLYRWFPSVLKAITIVRPETLVRWHRAGFRRYWRWKSRSLGGRPQIDADLRALIRRMSVDNPLWGAPRIRPSRRGGPSARGRELPANGRSGQRLLLGVEYQHFDVGSKNAFCFNPGCRNVSIIKGPNPHSARVCPRRGGITSDRSVQSPFAKRFAPGALPMATKSRDLISRGRSKP